MARRKPVTAIAVAQPVPTIIEFLLDETGSMGSCKQETVAGFNDFLVEQQRQPGLCLLSLTKFDTGGQKTPYVDVDIQMVPFMMLDWFNPGGGTNLRDTMGSRMASLRARISDWSVKPNVLFVVMTDGDDNASREYTEQAVSDAIKAYTDVNWTFVYLGADQDALRVASRLGFPEGNVKSFASAKMRETMKNLSAATTAYRATRADTSAASKNFFE